ncbi:hypothetical protein [Bacillus sp. B-jedd]|uniref:hypothetical protein n=1 Tax=Bacillus sp. B-jedd TaxID=1476857 RepID=UPI00051558AC|nr:hypothetical protein [Bacillus sp. B-jedd]CEG25672.1 hypothetical protein BN1002_00488 [Bacillus sp. B-jedd]
MLSRKDEMKNWLLNEVCKADPGCDKKIRELILADKKLVKKINEIFYTYNPMNDIKKSIMDFLTENKIIIRTCKECGKKNVISSDDILEASCEDCLQPLLKRQVQKKTVSFHKESQENYEGKKCIYCGSPVAPFSNMVCPRCYQSNSLYSIRFT